MNWRLLDGTDVYGWPVDGPRIRGVHIAACMSDNDACVSLGASSATAPRASMPGATRATCDQPGAERTLSAMAHVRDREPTRHRAWQRIRAFFRRRQPREAAGD